MSMTILTITIMITSLDNSRITNSRICLLWFPLFFLQKLEQRIAFMMTLDQLLAKNSITIEEHTKLRTHAMPISALLKTVHLVSDDTDASDPCKDCKTRLRGARLRISPLDIRTPQATALVRWMDSMIYRVDQRDRVTNNSQGRSAAPRIPFDLYTSKADASSLKPVPISNVTYRQALQIIQMAGQFVGDVVDIAKLQTAYIDRDSTHPPLHAETSKEFQLTSVSFSTTQSHSLALARARQPTTSRAALSASASDGSDGSGTQSRAQRCNSNAATVRHTAIVTTIAH